MPAYGDGFYGDGDYGTGAAVGGDVYGAVSFPITLERVTQGVGHPNDVLGQVSIAAQVTIKTGLPVSTTGFPSPLIEVSWATDPLAIPSYVDITEHVRQVATTRGRSFEYDRPEAGVLNALLDNRDSRFDPRYTSGPYYPNVIPTRRIRVEAVTNGQVFPIYEGFTEGYPNAFPGDGWDATVTQAATDWFYPLTAIKFTPGSTTVRLDVTTAPAEDTEETLYVVSTDLPMPQAFPFPIQVGTAPNIERMNVLAIVDDPFRGGGYTVTRGFEGSPTRTHPIGATVRSEAVRFGEEISGARITNCLDMLGVATADRDLDTGNSLISASDDLVGQSILEHILLIAEAENGRFFAARDGTITFRERHWQFLNELTVRNTFGNDTDAGEIPFLSGTGNVLAHDDSKLFNIVRITIPDGSIAEARDQDSIDAHFDRVLEKQWPLAERNEAQAAAEYLLFRLHEAQLRMPKITITPQGEAEWARILSMELAQRHELKVDPPIGFTDLDSEVIVERIAYSITPERWDVSLEFSEADTTTYWLLGVVGHGELDQHTTLAY